MRAADLERLGRARQAEELHLAEGGAPQGREHLEQGGLARAVVAREQDDRASRHFVGEAREDPAAAHALGDVVEADDRGCHVYRRAKRAPPRRRRLARAYMYTKPAISKANPRRLIESGALGLRRAATSAAVGPWRTGTGHRGGQCIAAAAECGRGVDGLGGYTRAGRAHLHALEVAAARAARPDRACLCAVRCSRVGRAGQRREAVARGAAERAELSLARGHSGQAAAGAGGAAHVAHVRLDAARAAEDVGAVAERRTGVRSRGGRVEVAGAVDVVLLEDARLRPLDL